MYAKWIIISQMWFLSWLVFSFITTNHKEDYEKCVKQTIDDYMNCQILSLILSLSFIGTDIVFLFLN